MSLLLEWFMSLFLEYVVCFSIFQCVLFCYFGLLRVIQLVSSEILKVRIKAGNGGDYYKSSPFTTEYCSFFGVLNLRHVYSWYPASRLLGCSFSNPCNWDFTRLSMFQEFLKFFFYLSNSQETNYFVFTPGCIASWGLSQHGFILINEVSYIIWKKKSMSSALNYFMKQIALYEIITIRKIGM